MLALADQGAKKFKIQSTKSKWKSDSSGSCVGNSIFPVVVASCCFAEDVISVGNPSVWPGTRTCTHSSKNVVTHGPDHFRTWSERSDLELVFGASRGCIHTWTHRAVRLCGALLATVLNAACVLLSPACFTVQQFISDVPP